MGPLIDHSYLNLKYYTLYLSCPSELTNIVNSCISRGMFLFYYLSHPSVLDVGCMSITIVIFLL